MDSKSNIGVRAGLIMFPKPEVQGREISEALRYPLGSS